MGETVEQGLLQDRWRVRYGGKLMFAETIRLAGDVAARLAEPAIGSGATAVATVLAVPGDESAVQRLREQSYSGEVAVSAWNGLAVARLCARDAASLRSDAAAVMRAFGGVLPRLWLN
jgi:urease accessory protein